MNVDDYLSALNQAVLIMLVKVTPSARVQAGDIELTCLGHMDFKPHGIPLSPWILGMGGMGQNLDFHIFVGLNFNEHP